MPSEIVLELLGTRYVIRSAHREWIDLAATLWRPFVTAADSGDAHALEVRKENDGWRLSNFANAPTGNSDPWLILHQIRDLTSQFALKMATGVIGLHGSVIEKDGLVLILSGPPEAGKTTLTLELLNEGWSYVSDDAAPLDTAGGAVLSFPKPLHLRDPVNWARFEDRWGPPAWLPRPTRSALIPADAFSVVDRPSVVPTALIFPTFRSKGPKSSAELTSGQAALRCCQNLLTPGLAVENALPQLARLCEGLWAAEMVYEDTDQALEILNTLFTNWGEMDRLA